MGNPFSACSVNPTDSIQRKSTSEVPSKLQKQQYFSPIKLYEKNIPTAPSRLQQQYLTPIHCNERYPAVSPQYLHPKAIYPIQSKPLLKQQLAEPLIPISIPSYQVHKNLPFQNFTHKYEVNPVCEKIIFSNFDSDYCCSDDLNTHSSDSDNENDKSLKICKIYKSKRQFVRIFTELIKMELKEIINPLYSNEKIQFLTLDEFNQLIKELNLNLNQTVHEDEEARLKKILKSNSRRLALFCDRDKKFVKIKEEEELNVVGFETEMIRLKPNMWLIEFEFNVPQKINNFEIFANPNDGGLDRMKTGLKSYLKTEVNPDIESVLLGKQTHVRVDFDVKIHDFSANGLFILNPSQVQALKNALKYRVSLIQGPPGTGKTQTISALVYHINKLCRPTSKINNFNLSSASETHSFRNYFTQNSKILICAASNNPIFDLKRKLAAKGIQALQVLAAAKEEEFKNEPGTLRYYLDIDLKTNSKYNELRKSLSLQKKKKSLLKSQIKEEMFQIEKPFRIEILEKFDIICCTTRVLQNALFRTTNFDFVIVDEATQALEPDVTQCLMKNAKHLVLVGDIHQLGPVIKSTQAKELGLDVPTIQRLQDLGAPLTMLDVQYRMHAFISEYSSRTFYAGKVKTEKTVSKTVELPKSVQTSAFFYHVKGKESNSGSSYLNEIEAAAVIQIILFFVNKNVAFDDFGVITFYDGQREHLKDEILKRNMNGIEVMSVDASQGREKEIIVLSCVRSNDKGQLGFLNEYRRLNVAMTRAKSVLVVCGDGNSLKCSKLWKGLIWYFRVNNAIFSGEVGRMRRQEIGMKKAKGFVLPSIDKYRN